MKVVIVKHEEVNKPYLFEVPSNEYLLAGEEVKVHTKNGYRFATALTSSFDVDIDSDTYKFLLGSFQATDPLDKVVGIYAFREYKVDLTNDAK